MRNLHREAAIWSLFTSDEFFEAAAKECEQTMTWFGSIAISKHVVNFGRNNQIFDTFKSLARDFRRGAEMAKLDDYKLVWDTARCLRGDIRGMMEQPLHSWMSESEYQEFSRVRIGRVMGYARPINRALHNAMVGAENFFNPSPNYPERTNDDDGFPGNEIVEVYDAYANLYKESLAWKIPDPLPEYRVDTSVSCRTGDEVPWTGVWFPETGLEYHSLTFAVKGLRMQPVYRIVKTKEEAEVEGASLPTLETVAVATSWHPLILSGHQAEVNRELWAKAGQPCPKAGIWQPTDPGAAQRTYEAGEKMLHLGSPYGFTMWRWIADR